MIVTGGATGLEHNAGRKEKVHIEYNTYIFTASSHIDEHSNDLRLHIPERWIRYTKVYNYIIHEAVNTF